MNNSEDNIVWLPNAQQGLYSSLIETRHTVVFPWLVKTILQRTPSSVLDYGAGDGFLLEQLRKVFDGELLYFDPSPAFETAARRRLHNKDVVFYPSPQSLPQDRLDIIASTAVWMTIDTYEGCVEYLAAQHRALRPGGAALITVTHPCFRQEKYSTFATQFKNEHYLEEGVPFVVSIFAKEKRIEFTDYHWNLSTMVRQASDVGFRLRYLTELADVADGNRRGAPWICLEFQKD